MKNRINDLVDKLSDGLYERHEVVAISLLSTLSGQSIFLYGLPGTAKSLIARRLSKAFKDSTHFEYLMQRFSTPEDVFGPVSIQELKQDRYIRKTKGYLPTADFAFLDEIWKSSPAILNTLLTIINERIFRNGDTEEKVPLKALIAASNETPPANQGLEALYDRFVMRLVVDPMKERNNFESLLDGAAVRADIHMPEKLQFSHDEWEKLLDEIPKIKISKEVMDIIHSIRISLEEFNQNNVNAAVYVSDRRWQKIALVLKTAALLCDRKEVIPVDTLVIRHCLWTLEENRESIEEIIESCVKEFSIADRDELAKWLAEHNDLDKDVADTFFYTEDIYDTEEIAGKACLVITSPKVSDNDDFNYNDNKMAIRLYIPVEYMKTKQSFHPFNEDGGLEYKVMCCFNGGQTCTVSLDTHVKSYGWNTGHKSSKFNEWFKANPSIKIKKKDQKQVPSRTKANFVSACKGSLESMNTMITNAASYIESQRQQNETPFIPAGKGRLVLAALDAYRQELENHKLNAEHLLSKVESYAVSK